MRRFLFSSPDDFEAYVIVPLAIVIVACAYSGIFDGALVVLK